jgi:hypothetical protein
MNTCYLYPVQIERFKAAYTTRHVNLGVIATLLSGDDLQPRSGDLVLAKVDLIGQHTQIELTNSRKAVLFPGDEILVCYGNRYAPDQFEAEIPPDLSPCHLVAGGGLAARVLSQHQKIDFPTTIIPLGLLGDRQKQRINIKDWALPPTTYFGKRPLTFAVVGTSMNSGKTTTAAYLIKGLVASGLKVGAAKVTGTGAGKDIWLMRDAGACLGLDFTDAGFPSTYRATVEQLQEIQKTLTSCLAAEGVDVIVLEIADGLYQKETSVLVSSPSFRKQIDGMLFAANSAMGAIGGVEWLRRYDLPLLAVSGCLTRSPLAMREAQAATNLPILDLERLSSPGILSVLSEQTTSSINLEMVSY